MMLSRIHLVSIELLHTVSNDTMQPLPSVEIAFGTRSCDALPNSPSLNRFIFNLNVQVHLEEFNLIFLLLLLMAIVVVNKTYNLTFESLRIGWTVM